VDVAPLFVMETIGSYCVIVAFSAQFAVSFPLVYHYGGISQQRMWRKRPILLLAARLSLALE
jgi:hypothetical protein